MEEYVECPDCKELTKSSLQKCEFCGEWLHKNEKQQVQTKFAKKIFVVISIIIAIIIGINVYVDPLDILTQGCSSNGNTTLKNPFSNSFINAENFFCDNKEYSRIVKYKDIGSKYYEYRVIVNDSLGREYCLGNLYWSKGHYYCAIWNENRTLIYDDICTKSEFVGLVKKHIKLEKQHYSNIKEKISEPTTYKTPITTNEKFYVTSYDVKVNVDKNKVAHVKENIGVNFTEPRHGIYRTIPLNGDTVSNIIVSEQNSITNSKDKAEIKIGNLNKVISGNHNYSISYDYNFTNKTKDFNLYIVGSGWNTTIHNINFDITLDKTFVKNDNLKLYLLNINGKTTEGLKYSIQDNKIIGNTTRILNPNEAILIEVQ